MITRKQVIPYAVAAGIAIIAACMASLGVYIAQIQRTNPSLGDILIAGFVILAAFVRLLPSPESVIHPPTTFINATDQPITVERTKDGNVVTVGAGASPLGARPPIPKGTKSHIYADPQVIAPGATVVVSEEAG
jgi:hypothetical protein